MSINFDNDTINELIDELDFAINELTEATKEVDTDEQGKGRHNDPRKAKISRDLLRAQDLCRLIQGELSVAYWSFKGHEDPRRIRAVKRETRS